MKNFTEYLIKNGIAESRTGDLLNAFNELHNALSKLDVDQFNLMQDLNAKEDLLKVFSQTQGFKVCSLSKQPDAKKMKAVIDYKCLIKFSVNIPSPLVFDYKQLKNVYKNNENKYVFEYENESTTLYDVTYINHQLKNIAENVLISQIGRDCHYCHYYFEFEDAFISKSIEYVEMTDEEIKLHSSFNNFDDDIPF